MKILKMNHVCIKHRKVAFNPLIDMQYRSELDIAKFMQHKLKLPFWEHLSRILFHFPGLSKPWFAFSLFFFIVYIFIRKCRRVEDDVEESKL